MDKVPVMVMRNKTNVDRYLASSMDVGDWEDENLDVKLDEVQNAYIIARKDLAIPTMADFEEHKAAHATFKQQLIKEFGKDAITSFNFELICEHYVPVNIEITKEQYEYSRELVED